MKFNTKLCSAAKCFTLLFLFLLTFIPKIFAQEPRHLRLIYKTGSGVIKTPNSKIPFKEIMEGRVVQKTFTVITKKNGRILFETGGEMFFLQPQSYAIFAHTASKTAIKLIYGSIIIKSRKDSKTKFLYENPYSKLSAKFDPFSSVLLTSIRKSGRLYIDFHKGTGYFNVKQKHKESADHFHMKSKRFFVFHFYPEKTTYKELESYHIRVFPQIDNMMERMTLSRAIQNPARFRASFNKNLAEIFKAYRQKEQENIEKTVSEPYEKKTTKAEKRTIKINTEPPHADIFFNGTNIGHAPKIITVNDGKYPVSAVKKGYQNGYRRINTRYLKKSSVFIKMSPLPAILEIVPKPEQALIEIFNQTGKKVYSSLKKRPLEGIYKIQCSPGTYHIKISYKNYKTFEKEIMLKTGETLRIPVELFSGYDFRFSKFLPLSNESLKYPSGLAVYKNHLFIADSGNARVLVLNLKTQETTEIKTFNILKLIRPSDVCVNDDLLAVSDELQNKVFFYKIKNTPNNTNQKRGLIKPIFFKMSAINANLRIPLGISTDGTSFYAADSGGGIFRIYRDGVETGKIAKGLDLVDPNYMIPGETYFYFFDWGNVRIVETDHDGKEFNSMNLDYSPGYGVFLGKNEYLALNPEDNKIEYYKRLEHKRSIDTLPLEEPYGAVKAGNILYVSDRKNHKIGMFVSPSYE